MCAGSQCLGCLPVWHSFEAEYDDDDDDDDEFDDATSFNCYAAE